jgi:hypothetical protein
MTSIHEELSAEYGRDLKEWKQAVFDLGLWVNGRGGNSFASMLFSLIGKADTRNRFRIWRGFPVHVEVFRAWERTREPESFFSEIFGEAK